MSTDRRSGGDEVRISSLKYLKDYKHFELINDKNLTEKEVVLRKSGTMKKYICGQRMVYTKPIRKIFQSFTEKEGKCCSLSIFSKYKPFYIITNPIEQEKEPCLCKRCLNAHLLLSGINIFRKTTKLTPHLSVTMFMKQQHTLFPGLLDDLKHYEIFEKYPECTSEKEVCYYVFETKEESYIKNGEGKTYTRTARVDKKKQPMKFSKN